MTHNLLPCPFCGDEPTLRKSGARNNSQYMAMCARGCGACNGWKDTPEAANAAWNRRAEPIGNSDELKAKIQNYIKWIEEQKDGEGYLNPMYRSQIDAFEIVLDWMDELSLKKEDK